MPSSGQLVEIRRPLFSPSPSALARAFPLGRVRVVQSVLEGSRRTGRKRPGGLTLVSRGGVSLFRGVNMYAMLTGALPFTVEPFSLRALYQKMVDKEMNPLPTQLSTGNVPAGRGSALGHGQRGCEDHPRLEVSS